MNKKHIHTIDSSQIITFDTGTRKPHAVHQALLHEKETDRERRPVFSLELPKILDVFDCPILKNMGRHYEENTDVA